MSHMKPSSTRLAGIRLARIRLARIRLARTRGAGNALLLALTLAGCSSWFSDTGSGQPSVDVAVAALNGGSPRVALQVAQSVLSRKPDDVRALLVRGDALTQLGQNQDASTAFQRALELDPASLHGKLGLGRLRLTTDPAEARVLFQDVLKSEPRNVSALTNLGIALDLLGQHAEARDAYQQVLKDNPGNTAVQVNLALSLGMSGDTGAALRVIEPLAINPSAPTKLRHNYAAILAMAGREADAAAVLKPDLSPDEVRQALTAYTRGRSVSVASAPAAPTTARVASFPAPMVAAAQTTSAVEAAPVVPLAPAPLIPAASAPLIKVKIASATPAAAAFQAPTSSVHSATTDPTQKAAPTTPPVVGPEPAGPATIAATPLPEQPHQAMAEPAKPAAPTVFADTGKIDPTAPAKAPLPIVHTPTPQAGSETIKVTETAASIAPAPTNLSAFFIPMPKAPLASTVSLTAQSDPLADLAPRAFATGLTVNRQVAAHGMVALARPVMPFPLLTDAPPASTEPSAKADIHVQLGAFSSEGAARAEWQRLKMEVPELLMDRPPTISMAMHDGVKFWRLRTRGFADMTTAHGFCAQLRPASGQCLVLGI